MFMIFSSFSSELYRGFLLRHNKYRIKNNNSFRTAQPQQIENIMCEENYPPVAGDYPQKTMLEAGYLDADTLFSLVQKNMRATELWTGEIDSSDSPHADLNAHYADKYSLSNTNTGQDSLLMESRYIYNPAAKL